MYFIRPRWLILAFLYDDDSLEYSEKTIYNLDVKQCSGKSAVTMYCVAQYTKDLPILNNCI